MSRDNKEDILLDSKAVNLLSGIKLLIIGGGRAGLIKLKSFLKKGFRVDMLSPRFLEEIESISAESPELSLIKGRYKKSYLDSYELIVIGTNDMELNEEIAYDCRVRKKLYLYLPDYRAGNISIPVEVETENIKLSVTTVGGSPRTALFLAEKLKSSVAEYDDFVNYVCSIRKSIDDSDLRREVMEFLNTEEFYQFYRAGKGEIILRTFYGGDFIEYNSGN